MSSVPVEPTFLSTPLLLTVAGVAFCLAAGAPLYHLILFDLALIPIVGNGIIAGTWVDPSDMIFACFALALVVRVRFSPAALIKKLPYLLPWLALGIFMTMSYLSSPVNADNLTNPARIAYQVVRYCWKPLIYYPLCLLVVRDLRQARQAWTAILVGGNICAVHAIWQGYNNVFEPPGPFETGNELAAVLIIPFLIAVSGLIFPTSRFNWLFSGLSVVLIARAFLFSASRGGMVSAMVGCGVLFGLLMLNSTGRVRLLKLVPVAVLSVVGLLAVRPDVLDRPTVRHAFTLFEGARTSTMQWRINERWPHFFRIAVGHPVLGTGTMTDLTLSDDANTPHNGYLALAVKYGFPTLGLFLFFLLRLLRDCQLAYRRSRSLEERVFFLTLAAAVLGVATHNLVETTFTMDVVQNLFWMFCAVGAAHIRLWDSARFVQPEQPSPTAGRRPGALAPA